MKPLSHNDKCGLFFLACVAMAAVVGSNISDSLKAREEFTRDRARYEANPLAYCLAHPGP